MSRSEIRACDLSVWYEEFASCTFRTELVPLSTEFVEFLKREGIFLPDKNTVVNDWSSDSEAENWADENPVGDVETENLPPLPENDPTIVKIENVFRLPDMGSVLPKLNWKCPSVRPRPR